MVVAIEKRRDIDGKPSHRLRAASGFVRDDVLGFGFRVAIESGFHRIVRAGWVRKYREGHHEVRVFSSRAALGAGNCGLESLPVGRRPSQTDARFDAITIVGPVFNLCSEGQVQPIGIHRERILGKKNQLLEPQIT
jgi:hypothetical protein